MATQLIRTIRSSGGHFTNITNWNASHNPTTPTDLTTSLVFSYTGAGGILNEELVTGAISGATGTAVGLVVDGQILVRNITGGVFQSGETITSAFGSAILSDAGDLPIVVAECYDDWPSGLVDQIALTFLSDATAYPKVTVAPGHRHQGVFSLSGFSLAPVGVSAYIGSSQYEIIEWLQTEPLQLPYKPNDQSIMSNCLADVIVGGTGFSLDSNTILVNCANRGGALGFIDGGTVGVAVYLNCSTFETTLAGFAHFSPLAVHKNCLSVRTRGGDYAVFGAIDPSSSNNASSDLTAVGTAPLTSVSPVFVSSGGGDYHYDPSEVVLTTAGVDLSSNIYYPFTTDIDGDDRVVPWSIGFDQYIVQDIVGSGGGLLTPINGLGQGTIPSGGTGGAKLTTIINGLGQGYVDMAIGSGGTGSAFPVVVGSGSGTIVGAGLGGYTLEAITGAGVGYHPVYGNGGATLELIQSGFVTGQGGLNLRSNIFGGDNLVYEDSSTLKILTDDSIDHTGSIGSFVPHYLTDGRYFVGVFVKKSIDTHHVALRASFHGDIAEYYTLELNPSTGDFAVSNSPDPLEYAITDIGDYYFIWMEVRSSTQLHSELKLQFFPVYGQFFGIEDPGLTGSSIVWGLTAAFVEETQYSSKVGQGCFKCAELLEEDHFLIDGNGGHILTELGENIVATTRVRGGNPTLLGEYNRTSRASPLTEVI